MTRARWYSAPLAGGLPKRRSNCTMLNQASALMISDYIGSHCLSHCQYWPELDDAGPSAKVPDRLRACGCAIADVLRTELSPSGAWLERALIVGLGRTLRRENDEDWWQLYHVE